MNQTKITVNIRAIHYPILAAIAWRLTNDSANLAQARVPWQGIFRPGFTS